MTNYPHPRSASIDLGRRLGLTPSQVRALPIPIANLYALLRAELVDDFEPLQARRYLENLERNAEHIDRWVRCGAPVNVAIALSTLNPIALHSSAARLLRRLEADSPSEFDCDGSCPFELTGAYCPVCDRADTYPMKPAMLPKFMVLLDLPDDLAAAEWQAHELEKMDSMTLGRRRLALIEGCMALLAKRAIRLLVGPVFDRDEPWGEHWIRRTLRRAWERIRS